MIEEGYLERLRRLIEMQYLGNGTGCGASFGELLCYEIHERGLTFKWLAQKWGVSLPTIGELIWDHCKRLEEEPKVNHAYQKAVYVTIHPVSTGKVMYPAGDFKSSPHHSWC